MTVKESFDNIPDWIDEIVKYSKKNLNIILIGNKLDLASKRLVNYSMLKSYAEQHSYLFFETSAKQNNNNLLNTFIEISKKLEEKLELINLIKRIEPVDLKKVFIIKF